jgi:Raf kinase inhibitor-like YbhB/YbcL family protein
MELTSKKFENNEMIPKKYSCKGQDVNPPLEIKDIPDGTESMVLIVDDPDAPMGTWTHWVLYNINPKDHIEENSIPGLQAFNDFDKKNYGGPCPPSGTHRYFFRLYALDKKIQDQEGKTREDVEKEMQGHVIDKTELIGLFKK